MKTTAKTDTVTPPLDDDLAVLQALVLRQVEQLRLKDDEILKMKQSLFDKERELDHGERLLQHSNEKIALEQFNNRMFMGANPENVVANLSYGRVGISPIHGYGLFADSDIDEGVVLGSLDGQLIPWRLYSKYQLALEWNAIDEETLLVRPYRTKYSYINHQREPNLTLLQYPLRVVTLKHISKGEEMTLDYRKEPLPLEYIESKGKYYL